MNIIYRLIKENVINGVLADFGIFYFQTSWLPVLLKILLIADFPQIKSKIFSKDAPVMKLGYVENERDVQRLVEGIKGWIYY